MSLSLRPLSTSLCSTGRTRMATIRLTLLATPGACSAPCTPPHASISRQCGDEARARADRDREGRGVRCTRARQRSCPPALPDRCTHASCDYGVSFEVRPRARGAHAPTPKPPSSRCSCAGSLARRPAAVVSEQSERSTAAQHCQCSPRRAHRVLHRSRADQRDQLGRRARCSPLHITLTSGR